MEINLHIEAKTRPYKVALEILWKLPEPWKPPKMYWVGVAQHKSLEHWVLDRFLQRPTSIDGAETWIGIVGKGSAWLSLLMFVRFNGYTIFLYVLCYNQ